MNTGENTMTDAVPLIRKTEHTGLTVSSIDEALKFWVGALGFTLDYRKTLGGGPVMENIVGVPGADLSNAMVVTTDGYRIELLEYSAPDDRRTLVQRPCDVGSAHVTFTVEDMDEVLARSGLVGWKPQGEPQRLPSGAVVVYVRGPDGHTVEFISTSAPIGAEVEAAQ
jgi:catechol 2,3-dioxygenase-like lactoylglutathione lyase family enzyme